MRWEGTLRSARTERTEVEQALSENASMMTLRVAWMAAKRAMQRIIPAHSLTADEGLVGKGAKALGEGERLFLCLRSAHKKGRVGRGA